MQENTINAVVDQENDLLVALKTNINLGTSEPEKELAIRSWKNDLITKPTKDVVDLLHYINTDDSLYIKKTLLPLLKDSLQIKNIVSLLTIIQHEYAKALGGDRSMMFMKKKGNIREKLTEMYAAGLLDNKLIFGLGIYMVQNPKQDPFHAGTFWEDVQKWLFGSDNTTDSFWDAVTTKRIHPTTQHDLKQTLSQ